MRLLVFCLLLPVHSFAATFAASDGTVTAVQAAITLASNGDIVTIPVGTNEWSTRLIVSKGITLQGAGATNTVILDNVPNSGPWSSTCDISVTLVANYVTRITGIEIRVGTRSSSLNSGNIYISGSALNGSRGVVDNCKFGVVNSRAHIFVNGAIGVAHHNSHSMNGKFAFDIRHGNWLGLSNADGSWADDSNFGTDKFWFVEDSTFTQTGVIFESLDTYEGARWVWRHNTMTKSRWATHGTDSSGRPRGTRAIEVYNNTLTGDGVATSALTVRSGSALVFSNTITGWNVAFPQSVFALRAYRMESSQQPWTGAAGTNNWDNNDPTGVFESGTVTFPSTTSTRLFGDSTKTWTANQWAGYTVRNLSTGRFAQISTNGTTNIFHYADIYSPTVVFSVGHSYEIRRVLNVLDQPGVGAGDVINFSVPAWPNQVVDMCYEWTNSVNGLNAGMSGGDGVIKPGLHYTNDTIMTGYSPFTYPHPLQNPTGGVSTVTISIADADAGEPVSGFGTGSFIVTRTGDNTTNLVVNYVVTGTAASGDDYTSIGTSITILSGDNSATNVVTVIDDPDVEALESVIITLDPGGYTIGAVSAGTVYVYSDDAASETVTVSTLDATGGEPASGLGNGSIVFTRTGSTATNLTVNFTVAGTATSGVDFTSLGTSTVILAGKSSVTNTVTVLDDSSAEDLETVIVTVTTNFAAYVVALTNMATVTIADDEPTVSVSATDVTAGELNSGSGTGELTFTRTGSTASSLTVSFSVLGSSTGISGVDYIDLGSTVIIPAGSATATLLVTVIDDYEIEGDENIAVSVNEADAYHADAPAANVTVTDDEFYATVKVGTGAFFGLGQ